MKPTHFTPTHRGCPNETKSVTKGIVVWKILTRQTNKTNKLPSFIGGCFSFNWNYMT
jgi:hypothetical protein